MTGPTRQREHADLGSSRLAILSIAIFFVAGGLLFRTVDMDKGRGDRETLRSVAVIS